MAQTQNLILRIVAQRGRIGSSELAEVARKFGLSASATRSAANRMSQTGLLAKTGQGRGNLQYKVGPQGQALIEQVVARILRLHVTLEEQLSWDGRWLVVTFTIPEEQRDKRDTFRTRLVESGFGLLSAGVWISPFDQTAEITSLIDRLELEGQVFLLRGDRLSVPGKADLKEVIYRVWNLKTLETRYHTLINRIEGLLAQLEQFTPNNNPEALFFKALDLQSEFVDIISVQDPCLPLELLPADWPSRRAHELFHRLTDLIDQLELVGGRYEYLLYNVIQGMELLESYWPKRVEDARRQER